MATEKRLIDANALSNAIPGISKDMKRPGAVELACLLMIAEARTVDAVEVVHGRWEDVFKGNCAWARYKCSVCGGYALYRHEQDIIGKWETVQALTAYCPYCGSYMEEGEMNGNL